MLKLLLGGRPAVPSVSGLNLLSCTVFKAAAASRPVNGHKIRPVHRLQICQLFQPSQLDKLIQPVQYKRGFRRQMENGGGTRTRIIIMNRAVRLSTAACGGGTPFVGATIVQSYCVGVRTYVRTTAFGSNAAAAVPRMSLIVSSAVAAGGEAMVATATLHCIAWRERRREEECDGGGGGPTYVYSWLGRRTI